MSRIRGAALTLLALWATAPVASQHSPAISAAVTVVSDYRESGTGVGGTVRGEVPVVRVSRQIALVVGAGGWVARMGGGGEDGPKGYTARGGGPFAGVAWGTLREGGAVATITAGVEWFEAPEHGCGLVPPWGCPPQPEVDTRAFTLGARIHQPIGPRTAVEGGLVLVRHELRVESRWGSRFELGLRFGLRK